MERKRRARAGYTYEKCDGCGQDKGMRRKGQVCGDCRRLLDEAEAMRAELVTLKTPETQLYQWVDVPYGLHYYSGSYATSETRDRLARAVHAFAELITHPTRGTGHSTWNDKAPWLIPVSQDAGYHHRTVILARPEVRAALVELDEAIKAALPAAYNAGKREGSSVLLELAKGGLSLNDFEERTLGKKGR